MSDQANNLRRALDQKTQDEPKKTRVLSVVSGKGGVGKSNFSLNFSLGLAKEGKKVVLFDLDIGMANLDILLGLNTSYDVVDMVENEYSIWDIMEEGPLGLQIVAGGSGLSDIFEMTDSKKERFSRQMALLDGAFDYIIFDMGAGATADSLNFILSSNETIVITTPEPTSITDAYAMLKHLHIQDSSLPSSILVNRAETKKEGDHTAKNLQRVVLQFLKKEVSILGSIPQDKHVLQAVKRQEPFCLAYPSSKASKALQACLDTFIDDRKEKSSKESSEYQRFIGQLKNFLIGGR
ncbi:MinD/ParA family protein [Salibacterium salarium]|uniref:MinD/ParA family protein n=1 Tax=Salibacterium salarium TaxID=284579 RepID=A0A428N3B9_9BACI|nr:MinD/ParA family protein [Salibacterium salarium]RSL32838.1 MinD/ParA family protein [Salibacterium salarium]